MTQRLALATLFLLVCGALQAAASCSISATGITFSNYTGAMMEVTGTVSVKCTGNEAYDVGLDAGTGSGATLTNRSMTGPSSAFLSYGLYSDAGYSVNWGNSAATNWVPKSGNGSSTQIYTVYAQLPAGEFPATGSYTDTITATVYVGGASNAATTFTVNATVVANCTISATNLAFGTYTKALIDSTSTISVTCTNTTTYNVGLSAGNAPGATVTTRKMKEPGGNLLGYSLYQNSTYSTNWGNTVGTDTEAGTGTGALQNLTVYGQLPAGQNVEAGNYTDTITATVTY